MSEYLMVTMISMSMISIRSIDNVNGIKVE